MPVENCLPELFYITCGYTAEHSFTPIISSNAFEQTLSLFMNFRHGRKYQVKFPLSEDNQLKSIP